MDEFQIKVKDPEEFIAKFKDALSGRALGKIMDITFDTKNDDLVLTFKKLGTTKIHYSYKKEGDHLCFTKKKESMALTHRALKGEIQGKLERLLNRLGASPTIH